MTSTTKANDGRACDGTDLSWPLWPPRAGHSGRRAAASPTATRGCAPSRARSHAGGLAAA
eukprot:1926581-Pyramimonas_sp.AAC.1